MNKGMATGTRHRHRNGHEHDKGTARTRSPLISGRSSVAPSPPGPPWCQPLGVIGVVGRLWVGCRSAVGAALPDRRAAEMTVGDLTG